MKLFNRREFIKAGLTSSGSLLIWMHIPVPVRRALAQTEKSLTHQYIEITPGNDFFFVLDKAEMGQGVITGQATLFGEQAEISPSRFQVRTAPVHSQYGTAFGQQITGGSTSTSDRWTVLQREGAKLALLMRQAAAKHWQISEIEISLEDGTAINKKSGEKKTYGSLVQIAATLPYPTSAPLKPQDQFKYIGKYNISVDAKDKSTGSRDFGLDLEIPNMLTAVVLRPAEFGAKLKSFDAADARKLRGVKDIFPISSGVAVVCERYWQTLAVRPAIKIEWQSGPNREVSSEKIAEQYRKKIQASSGTDFSGASKVIEAEYILPYLAHACMEPMNAVAHATASGCEIWSPNQAPTLIRNEAARRLGLPREKVKVYTTKYLGGGFGRRSTTDYSMDAVEVSKKMGVPVKVVWSREDDMKHSPMRPLTMHRLRGAIKDGRAAGWEHQFGCESILQYLLPSWMGLMLPEWMGEGIRQKAGGLFASMMKTFGMSPTEPEGAHILYDIPRKRVKHHTLDLDIPIHFWRSVGHSYNGFVVESFIDELAHAAGKDPLEFRRQHLKEKSRLRGVLDRAAQMSRWTEPLPKNRSRGIAAHFSFESYVAEVAEVEIVNKQIRVRKVYCAVDCGQVANPDMVKKQMESGIIFGLSAALQGSLTMKDGAVIEENFDTYPVLRMDDTPEIEVMIVDSKEEPTGVGEPGLPPIAPAIANAVFAGTGQRLRRLPLQL